MTPRAGRPVAVRPARPPRAGAASSGAERLTVDELLDRLDEDGFPRTGTIVVGGGCAGLALGVALAEAQEAVAVVEARTGDRDGRTWCYWDTGQALLPEAVTRSWGRWEVRTPHGRAVAGDAAHPYRMVRAHDYRAAARARFAGRPGAHLIDGVRVSDGAPATPVSRPPHPRLVDARGGVPQHAVAPGRVLLHQRFVGQWIRTDRAVFDDTTVTLMDFPGSTATGVRFFYVLPVAPDLALVECTVFSAAAHGTEPFRQHIAAYVRQRWGLDDDGWTVEGEEAGSIPMTDARPLGRARGGVPVGLRAGIARPSTGYAFTRIQIAARHATEHGVDERGVRDGVRTRMLDAIFLRFLRDQPERAPEVFLRMFARLPGPLTVRFLTERASPLDELRLIGALPKRPFLRAATTTAVERLRALGA
ncbi:lycopene cyclase family protein [Amnibacterium soli]|uniref:Lycopene cyclase family protein n=1 Tax=Amnibacterium soli TaxID=1282736 RepID=A0ABP8YX75_9MICO